MGRRLSLAVSQQAKQQRLAVGRALTQLPPNQLALLQSSLGHPVTTGHHLHSEPLPCLKQCSYYSRITILVNRGFVPRRKVNPDTRRKGQVRGWTVLSRRSRPSSAETAFRTFPHRLREKSIWWGW